MSRDLSELLAEAVPRHGGGPDLEMIEARVSRRRRAVGAGAAVMAVALAVSLPQFFPDPPGRVVIGAVPGSVSSACTAASEGDQRLERVDIDGDGAPDRVVLVTREARADELWGCLAEGRAPRLEVGSGSDALALERVALGGVDGVALVGEADADGRRPVILLWLVEGEWRAVSTVQESGPGGRTTLEVVDHRIAPGRDLSG